MGLASGMRWAVAAALFFCVAAAEAADCVSGTRAVAVRANYPNRPAGPVAWTGSSLAVAKVEHGGPNAIYVALYDEDFNVIHDDTRIAASSKSGPVAFLWTGSELGLFYYTEDDSLVMQRISAVGLPFGAPVILPQRAGFRLDELDVAWDARRGAYAVLRSITEGPDRALWLTIVHPDGTIEYNQRLYFFVAIPAMSRIAVAENGAYGIFFEHATVPGTSFMRFDTDNRFTAPAPISASHSLATDVEARGNQFGLVKQIAIAGPRTVIRWLVIDVNGTIVVPERNLFEPEGIDVVPVSLLESPHEWALTYNNALFGTNVHAGDHRLRRFNTNGSLISDTVFNPDRLRAGFLGRDNFVWSGRSYLTGVGMLISRVEGSDSYLLRHCPLTAVAAVDRAIIRPRETITVTASASGGSPGYTYSWNFGETDLTEPGPTRAHTYERPGTYTITLTATDEAGGRSVTTTTVRVVTGRNRAVRHP